MTPAGGPIPAEIPRAKPRLRGLLHGVAVAFEVHTPRGRVSAIVFAASVAAMFGASGLYHRVTWSPQRRRWMRRLDHAGIYSLIAGTYTPFGLLVLRDEWRFAVLTV